jgi:4-alpha-glucanotransferase
VYPGTHDNDTTRGWWRTLDAEARERALALTGGSATTIAWDLWRTACTTAAHTAIAQAQDLLELPGSARTNIPGKPRGNWRWRPSAADFSPALAARTRALLDSTDRLPRT